jgi:hypothetical protein
VRGYGFALSVLAAIAICCGVLTSCGGSSAPVQDTTTALDLAAYAGEQSNCVTSSATLQAAQLCVAAVRDRWCRYSGSLQVVGACGQDASAPMTAAAVPVPLAPLRGSGGPAGPGRNVDGVWVPNDGGGQ